MQMPSGRFKALRVQKELTQEELASKLDCKYKEQLYFEKLNTIENLCNICNKLKSRK